MNDSNTQTDGLSLALRISLWGGAAVAVIGYAVLVPLKSRGMLPPELTWLRIIAGPALMVSIMPIYILMGTLFPRKLSLAWTIASLAFVVIGLAIIFIDSVLN